MTTLLAENGGRARHDMNLLAALYAADLEIHEARLAALHWAPADMGRRLEQLQNAISGSWTVPGGPIFPLDYRLTFEVACNWSTQS